MDSKANTYSSATNSADSEIVGYSLMKYRLKQWIYDNNHTQPFVAKAMGLSVDEFKRKLSEREKFNRDELWGLIKLMGAEEAFKVLYFPTKRMKRKIWWKVFGKKYKSGDLNE